jgi:hypothetical protein
MPVIGFLNGASAAPFAHLVAAFRQSLLIRVLRTRNDCAEFVSPSEENS